MVKEIRECKNSIEIETFMFLEFKIIAKWKALLRYLQVVSLTGESLQVW